ncbi:hypothetical protein ABT404_33720 [Streptomyces hyaluromycini]|uniref:Uncharacterized protein n=1 Tax=Streptomyces hyaluromycini TaxID=1377993 RepID=A0ABV1X5R4_9ACTN
MDQVRKCLVDAGILVEQYRDRGAALGAQGVERPGPVHLGGRFASGRQEFLVRAAQPDRDSRPDRSWATGAPAA